MTLAPHLSSHRLDPERAAYWYLRLNGFFQIENFVVHPELRGGQRTDADLLGARFPFRAERLFDDPNDIMEDDVQGLGLSSERIDVVIAEVKTNQPCMLNGPWTRAERQNVHRVLAAIGCLLPDQINGAADDIYAQGQHENAWVRIRLVAIGRDRSAELEARYPAVVQRTWADLLAFIWRRFDTYSKQKSQVDQWDADGRWLKNLAEWSGDAVEFVAQALLSMGVRPR